jgi:iron complex transport system ATP-binding protein
MAEQNTEMLWQLEGVCFAYGDKQVLGAIDLNLQAGHCYGILGANGSGKTTLLDLLCGLLHPAQGEIVFADQPLSCWRGRELARRVALVPQDFFVRFGFTVREVVEMGRHPHLPRFGGLSSEDYLLVDQVMEELEIADMASRQVTRLSGGEKQRVAVARALAQNPEVLVLDEATSNLDVFHSLSILGAIRKRVESGTLSVVAVIHDLNLAAFFCDQLLFLCKGRLLYQGATNEVLRAGIIRDVYGVDAEVRDDSFAGCRQVSYRFPQSNV